MAVDALCFIPCCKTKVATGERGAWPLPWPDEAMEQTWSKLERARSGLAYCIDLESMPTTAIRLYQGSFYSGFDVRPVLEMMSAGLLKVFIISAGFGVVDALEPIPVYDAQLKGEVARYWRDLGLTRVIAQICKSYSPRVVYGFFAGDRVWAGPGTKYRYFFTTGVELAISSRLRLEHAGCFFREEGRGAGVILKALGCQFGQATESSFRRRPHEMLEGIAVQANQPVRVAYEELGDPRF